MLFQEFPVRIKFTSPFLLVCSNDDFVVPFSGNLPLQNVQFKTRFANTRLILKSPSAIMLALVKSIVDLHGGSAIIESKLGDGTIVRLVFPLSPK